MSSFSFCLVGSYFLKTIWYELTETLKFGKETIDSPKFPWEKVLWGGWEWEYLCGISQNGVLISDLLS